MRAVPFDETCKRTLTSLLDYRQVADQTIGGTKPAPRGMPRIAQAAGRGGRELAIERREAEDRSCPCRNKPCPHGTVEPSGRSDRNAVLRRRAARIAELCLDYVPNAEFDREHAATEFLAPMPNCGDAPRKARAPSDLPSDLPSYLAGLYDVSLLTAEQERHLFRPYNYLKYRASMLRRRLDAAPTRPGRSGRTSHAITP